MMVTKSRPKISKYLADPGDSPVAITAAPTNETNARKPIQARPKYHFIFLVFAHSDGHGTRLEDGIPRVPNRTADSFGRTADGFSCVHYGFAACCEGVTDRPDPVLIDGVYGSGGEDAYSCAHHGTDRSTHPWHWNERANERACSGAGNY